MWGLIQVKLEPVIGSAGTAESGRAAEFAGLCGAFRLGCGPTPSGGFAKSLLALGLGYTRPPPGLQGGEGPFR